MLMGPHCTQTHISKTDGFRHTVQQETLCSAANQEFKYKDIHKCTPETHYNTSLYDEF